MNVLTGKSVFDLKFQTKGEEEEKVKKNCVFVELNPESNFEISLNTNGYFITYQSSGSYVVLSISMSSERHKNSDQKNILC